MIQGRVKIHDRTSFEIKLNYPLTEQDPRFAVEAYLFLPRSLGVNATTYRKEDFYSDVQGWLRFKTPTVTLAGITLPDGPLARLTSLAHHTAGRADDERSRDFIHALKLFTCTFRASLRDHVRMAARQKAQAEAEPLLRQFQEQVVSALAGFRSLDAILDVEGTDASVLKTLQHADEYLSLVTRVVLHAKSWDLDPRWAEELTILVRAERDHRRCCGYPSLPQRDGDNEEFVFRRSVLKKFFSSVLYLDTSTSRTSLVAEQVILSVAAGVAMVIATLMIWYSQSRWGAVSLPFFSALVLSYIFKDRIKDAVKIALASQTMRYLLDHRFHLLAGPGKPIGTIGEGFSFLRDRRIAPEIRAARDRSHITEIENDDLGEEVILYRKTVRLDRTAVEQLGVDMAMEGVTDITRVAVHRFLERMDDPEEPLYTVEDDGYSKAYARRVYHLQLILKVFTGAEIRLKRFRIVLDKEGLRRIEKVSSESLPMV